MTPGVQAARAPGTGSQWPHHLGQALRAARALARHTCGTLGWRRVTVDPAVTNIRAVRAWEKAGFRPVSVEGRTLLMEYRPAA